MRAKRRESQELQLSLFQETPEPETSHKPTVLDFVRARFEYGPEMDQEEYKRWIKILVNSTFKS